MSTALFDLSGKTALITGSSRGIGLAIARGMADCGADIVLNARSNDQLKAARAELTATFPARKISAFSCDVTDPTAVSDMVSTIEAEHGSINILVNNAGMQHRSPLEDFPIDKFDELMRLNVNAAFYVGQQVARTMIARKSGRIINICSLMSFHARYSIAPYTASKGAMAMLTKGMATDWARHGINVNGIAPGYFKTELNEALVQNKEFSTWVEGRTPKGRWGNVEELVGAAVFFASDASSFVTGQVLTVDGGMTATI